MKRLLSSLIITTSVLSSCTEPAPLAIQFGPDITLMQQSDYGLVTNLRSWDSTAVVASVTEPRAIVEDYVMQTGKRSHCHNEGFEWVYTLVNPANDTLLIEQRVYRDGVAFRYVLPSVREGEALVDDLTRYHVPDSTQRWMQRYTGPGYENFFPLCEGGVSPERAEDTRWGYPALMLLPDSTYMLIHEADLLRDHAGSLLENSQEDRHTYKVSLFDGYPLVAGADGRWASPWRLVIHGSLADVVESTLVTDVATPNQLGNAFADLQTGPSSWIYWAYNHGSQECDRLKEYVDLAAEMHWPYTLVDAEWDVMRGGNIEEVVAYAIERGVKPMIWYNSTTNWTGEWAPTPQGLLNDPADREAEFAKIAGWGVKGVKIDFFRDDNVETINYYLDLLESAARHGLLVNFHGGTIPRGWQRTYPNFISAEGVYGAEWYNNRPTLTDKAAAHNCTLPFTRNVIGPMDYTPGTFTDSQHPHITTHAHELALTVLFESGIQHMPDRPSAYRELPEQVREILMSLPTSWDDTRLLYGDPGRGIVLARRKGDIWYIAGINGLDEEQKFKFSLGQLGGTQIPTGETLSIIDGAIQTQLVLDKTQILTDEPTYIFCQPRGGFLIKTTLP